MTHPTKLLALFLAVAGSGSARHGASAVEPQTNCIPYFLKELYSAGRPAYARTLDYFKYRKPDDFENYRSFCKQQLLVKRHQGANLDQTERQKTAR